MFFRESYLAQALKYCDSMYACKIVRLYLYFLCIGIKVTALIRVVLQNIFAHIVMG
jgi:hypothetical protein